MEIEGKRDPSSYIFLYCKPGMLKTSPSSTDGTRNVWVPRIRHSRLPGGSSASLLRLPGWEVLPHSRKPKPLFFCHFLADGALKDFLPGLWNHIRGYFLGQRSPVFLAPGIGFMEESFSMDQRGGWFGGDSSGLYLLCMLFCGHLRYSIFRVRVLTPARI